MGASAVDWSMKARGAQLVDWRAASATAKRLCGPGPSVTAVDRARLNEDFAMAVSSAEALVTEFTDLSIEGSRTRAWVLGRGEWIDANLRSLERVVEPLAVKALGHKAQKLKAGWRTKTMGAQVGALFGYVSRKVLGQYDVFLPHDDEGLLYFLGPNVIAMERRFGFDREGFRLWLALHEVTHRVQFSSATWLRPYLTGMLDTYLATMELDPSRVLDNLRRAVEEARNSGSRPGMGIVLSMMSDEQKTLFERMQAMMSLLEGHASFVMNRLGADRVRGFDRMKRTLEQRRRNAGGLEKSFQKAIGFEQKIRQYSAGEAFVAEVVDEAGMSALNLAFSGPANLPTLVEVAEPSLWLSRVAPA
jgi:coenzyme F420 biosynthesis associated uncharacterized protein